VKDRKGHGQIIPLPAPRVIPTEATDLQSDEPRP